MKKERRHTRRNLFLGFLLAVLCIGVVELTACRYFAPETYHKIVDPVVQTASAAAQQCRSAAEAVANSAKAACLEVKQKVQEGKEQLALRWEAFTARNDQLASDPALGTDSPISDPAITELVEEGGRQVLTGGNISLVYFNQSDETWAQQPYGSDTIGGYGCGPTVMAMAVASMTETETDPALMAAWAVHHGYWARHSGSAHAIVPGAAQSFGIQSESFPHRTPEQLQEALTSGKVLVALMGPGHFTRSGHFILLRGITLGGDILVADPNSLQRSLTVWDAQLILDELSRSNSSGGPLWALSLPPS